MTFNKNLVGYKKYKQLKFKDNNVQKKQFEYHCMAIADSRYELLKKETSLHKRKQKYRDCKIKEELRRHKISE